MCQFLQFPSRGRRTKKERSDAQPTAGNSQLPTSTKRMLPTARRRKTSRIFGKLLALHATNWAWRSISPKMFRADPLSAEKAYQEMILGIARSGLTEAFEMLDDQGQSLEIDGTTYRKAETTPGRAMTTFRAGHLWPVTLSSLGRRRCAGSCGELAGADRWWTDACGGGPFNVPDEQSDKPARARTSGRGCAAKGPRWPLW